MNHRIISLIATMILFVACGQQNKQEIVNEKNTETMQNDECLICGAPLEYLSQDVMMECAICHKKEVSKTRCKEGHYVCNECHTSGLDSIVAICLSETSRDPIDVLERLMSMSFCHMHGPEHHVLVGASLLTAYKNAGGNIELNDALLEMIRRGKKVPGAACGYWGACGASISTGMFLSIVTDNNPFATDAWRLSNQMTSCALCQVAEHGGPRCCKRDSYLSILAAIDFVKENLGIEMEQHSIICSRSNLNNQCIREQCPFYPSNN